MCSCLHSWVVLFKNIYFSMSMACCVISHIVLFYKGMFKCLKEILKRERMKLELECKIFLLQHSKSFMLLIWF
jgi:hypothetical protein